MGPSSFSYDCLVNVPTSACSYDKACLTPPRRSPIVSVAHSIILQALGCSHLLVRSLIVPPRSFPARSTILQALAPHRLHLLPALPRAPTFGYVPQAPADDACPLLPSHSVSALSRGLCW